MFGSVLDSPLALITALHLLGIESTRFSSLVGVMTRNQELMVAADESVR